MQPNEESKGLSPASRAHLLLLILFTWGLRPRLYSSARFAGSVVDMTKAFIPGFMLPPASPGFAQKSGQSANGADYNSQGQA